MIRLPLVGIGGIHQDNAGQVIRAGTDGVAVVSAIVAAPCPRSAAATLKQRIQTARDTRDGFAERHFGDG